MALLAALVIFTVIARYCFSLSWKQLAEFNTTLFAFTTFWGMGINVIKDDETVASEHKREWIEMFQEALVDAAE